MSKEKKLSLGEPVLTLTSKGVEWAKTIDPSVSTPKEAASVLKDAFDDELLSREENLIYEIWVMSKSETPEGRDYYEDIGTIESTEVLTSITPVLSQWFKHKYAGNKDAYLDILKVGRAPFSLRMSTDIEDKEFGSIYQEEIAQ